MLGKAIFRKHTRLFLYMLSRVYFSQKEVILWCIENGEFKDKDSWENKGQFKDKMVRYGLIKEYSYKSFKETFPDEVDAASIAYKRSHERKRLILEMDSVRFLSFLVFDINKIKDEELRKLIPLQEYATLCLKESSEHTIQEYLFAFIAGCATQRIYTFNYPKIVRLQKVFSDYLMSAFDENIDSLKKQIDMSRELFEKNVRKYIESNV